MDNEKVAGLLDQAASATAENNSTEAITLYREALSLAGSSALVRYNLALELISVGQTSEAKDLLKAAAAIEETDADALAELGRLEIEEQHLGVAESILDKAISRDPHHPASLNNRGVIAFIKNRFPEAADFFKAAVSENPALADAWFNLADTCDELGDTASASEARYKLAALERP